MCCAGYSADQNGLLFIKQAVPNFSQFQLRVPCYGWSTDPETPEAICQWNGVGCNAANQVTSIIFPSNASLLTGEPLLLFLSQYESISYTLSCLEARCVCRDAAVKAAKILPLVGLASSKQDPINPGHVAQYLYRPPPIQGPM